MSRDEPVPGKSRRRFLADLLFLGGTVTAASLLAKSTIFEAEGKTPGPAPKPVVTPDKPVTPPPDLPAPGQMVLPPDGDYEAPKPECEPTPDCEEQQIEGKMVIPTEPQPQPAGAVPLPPPKEQ